MPRRSLRRKGISSPQGTDLSTLRGSLRSQGIYPSFRGSFHPQRSFYPRGRTSLPQGFSLPQGISPFPEDLSSLRGSLRPHRGSLRSQGFSLPQRISPPPGDLSAPPGLVPEGTPPSRHLFPHLSRFHHALFAFGVSRTPWPLAPGRSPRTGNEWLQRAAGATAAGCRSPPRQASPEHRRAPPLRESTAGAAGDTAAAVAAVLSAGWLADAPAAPRASPPPPRARARPRDWDPPSSAARREPRRRVRAPSQSVTLTGEVSGRRGQRSV